MIEQDIYISNDKDKNANIHDGLAPYLRKNMALLLTSACIFGLGWGLAQVPTNPLLVKKLHISNIFFGVLGTLAGIFSIVGPLIAPAISRKFVRKKWLFFSFNQFYVLSPCLMGGTVLLCVQFDHVNWLPALMMFFLLQWQCSPYLFNIPKAEFISQTISKPFLGRYYGLEGSIAPFASLPGIFLAGYLLRGDPSFARYAFCLLLGYGIAQLGVLLPLFAHEIPDLERPPTNNSTSLKTMVLVCWRDHSYRAFLMFVFALSILRAPFPFVPIYGFRDIGMAPSTQAIIVVVVSLSQILAAFPAGWLSDKWGAGKTMAVGLALQVITIVPLCLAHNQFGVYSYMGIDAASMMITQVACMAFVLRYAVPDVRGSYVAAYWMIQALAGILVNAPFAILLDKWSYATVFWVWSGLHLIVVVGVLLAVSKGVTSRMFARG